MLQEKGMSQCQCDTMDRTCSDCFVRFRCKPWCINCHNDFNEGECGCNNPKSHIRKGWEDNTKYIVKHTKEEKVILRGWQEDKKAFMDKAIHDSSKIAFGRPCIICDITFLTRGNYALDVCKTCLPAYMEKVEWVD